MVSSEQKKGKSPRESLTEMTVMMLPSDANPKGNVFGGVILKHVDLVAGLVAKRHARKTNCVTASIARMTFHKPVYIGNALILSPGSTTFAGRRWKSKSRSSRRT